MKKSVFNKICIVFAALLLVSANLKAQDNVEKLVTLWNHETQLDLAPLVQDLGFNFIWTHDPAYTNQTWEETHMYKCLQVPGVKYVLAKIERAAWGWTQEQSVRHAKWIAELSLEHEGIFGLYLNDFYDEIEDGHRTEEQWREIIDAAKSINPNLKLIAPHYPHRNQERHAFDFPIDGVILNIWGNTPELMANAEKHLTTGISHHPDRFVIAGLYLHSGMYGGRWLSEAEFKRVLTYYVSMLKQNKIAGIRIFSAGQLYQRPEYIEWAKDIMKDIN